MLEKTRAVWERTKNDIEKITFPSQLITAVIMSLYFIYAIIVRTGYFWANIPLLVLNIFNFAFIIITNQNEKDKTIKKKVKNVKKSISTIKLSIKLLTLCASLYSLYITALNATLLSIILTALMIVGWILSFVLEIMSSIITKRIDVFVESFMKDISLVIHTVNFFKKIGKNDVVPIPNEHEEEIEEMLNEYLMKHGAIKPAPAPIPAPAVAQAIAPAQAPKPKKRLFGRKK